MRAISSLLILLVALGQISRCIEGRRTASILSSPRVYQRIRGGSTESKDPSKVKNRKSEETDTSTTAPPRTVNLLITTSVGSSFLDKKKKLSLPSSSTLSELKQLISQKFPGSPPSQLQRLYYQSQLLTNETATLSDLIPISSSSSSAPVPLLLDMITGTAGYAKNLTISQAIEAYASTVVHLAYLGDKLRTIAFEGLSAEEAEEGGSERKTTTAWVMETLYYRELFEMVNMSLYEKYALDISEALEREKNPEYFSADTARWRQRPSSSSSSPSVPLSPILTAIAKEFDLNAQTLKSYLFYSFILLVTAKLGTADDGGRWMVLACIPLLWISKVRQLRLASKVMRNAVLAVLTQVDALNPLFPATYQVMAQQVKNWFVLEEEGGEETSSSRQEETS